MDKTIEELKKQVHDLEALTIQQAGIINILSKTDKDTALEMCVQSRDFILQQFCNLTVTYGEQKLYIRELEAKLGLRGV